MFDNQNNSLNTTQFNAAMSQALLASAIGINEMNKELLYILTPNPANDNITITINSKEENLSVDIYNTLGQLVIEQKMQNSTEYIQIDHLQAGTYFVKVKGLKGSLTKKLIKY